MSEFKVGDWVVSKDDCELVSEITYLQGGLAKIKNEKFDHVYSLQDFRHATPAEIKAGHRIDEPLEVLPKQPKNTPEPLVSMGEGVLAKPLEFEGIEKVSNSKPLDTIKSKNQQKTNTSAERVSESGITRTCDVIDECQQWINKEDPEGAKPDAWYEGVRAVWAVVDWLGAANSCQAELIQELNNEVDQLQQQCNEQAELGLIYESQLQEKQRRIDELEKNIKAMINHFAYSRDLAREEWKKCPGAYQDGKSDAYAMAQQWAEDALGGGV